MSGLREVFIKRYVVERTNKAEIRPEEQELESGRVVGKIDGMPVRLFFYGQTITALHYCFLFRIFPAQGQ